jgi:hypothetical protein
MRVTPRVQYFSSDGQGGGTVNMAVDGTTPQTFTVAVPTNYNRFTVARVLFFIEDNGAFDANKFANNLTLTNGIDFTYETGTSWDLLGGQPIKTNGHFGRVAYDVAVHTWGTGDEVLVSRWSFDKWMPDRNADRAGIELTGSETLKIVINDNLSTAVAFNAVAEGWIA